jgi:hypothetical protein
MTNSVHLRWAANTRARDALAIFADNSRHASRWAATLYANAAGAVVVDTAGPGDARTG